MAASDHLHPEQLRMFMTGEELKSYATPGDFPGHPRVHAAGWATKRREATFGPVDGPSLADSIQAEGVKEPVSISHRPTGPVLVNGHHRVAVAAELDQYVPVEHSQLDPPKVTPKSQWNSQEM